MNKNMPKSKNRWPVVYALYYQKLSRIARHYGYALALHGTMTRDMDLIAVPWVEKPSDPINLLKHISKRVNPFEYKLFMKTYGVPYTSTKKQPHGRVSYTMSVGGGGYLDISIIPMIIELRTAIWKDYSEVCVPNYSIPKGSKLMECYETERQIIVCGDPKEEEKSTHSCDEMGCSSVSHVLYRFDKGV